jgi:hypothetical protein
LIDSSRIASRPATSSGRLTIAVVTSGFVIAEVYRRCAHALYVKEMAMLLPMPCTQPDCHELVKGGDRCLAHRARSQATRSARRPSAQSIRAGVCGNGCARSSWRAGRRAAIATCNRSASRVITERPRRHSGSKEGGCRGDSARTTRSKFRKRYVPRRGRHGRRGRRCCEGRGGRKSTNLRPNRAAPSNANAREKTTGGGRTQN